MDQNYLIQQPSTHEPVTSNKENDIFDLIIKISIPLIIILVITVVLLFLKYRNNLTLTTRIHSNTENLSEANNSKYLEISNPVYSLTGVISEIEKKQLVIEVPSSIGTTKITLIINEDTTITHVPPSSPVFSGKTETGIFKKLSPSDLKIKNNVVITTVEDIRKYDGSPLNASIITVLNTATNDATYTINENEN